MILLRFTRTTKMMNSKENYWMFDRISEEFETKKQAKRFLMDEYGKCKKSKMYHNFSDSGSIHVGWVYCFKEKDYETGKTMLRQDWVSFHEEKYISPKGK